MHQSERTNFLLPPQLCQSSIRISHFRHPLMVRQTCYEIKLLENDIKTFYICIYRDKICPQIKVQHLTLPETGFRETTSEI